MNLHFMSDCHLCRESVLCARTHLPALDPLFGSLSPNWYRWLKCLISKFEEQIGWCKNETPGVYNVCTQLSRTKSTWERKLWSKSCVTPIEAHDMGKIVVAVLKIEQPGHVLSNHGLCLCAGVQYVLLFLVLVVNPLCLKFCGVTFSYSSRLFFARIY